VFHFVADLGNSRLKWARVDHDGSLVERVALPLDDLAWEQAWSQSAVLSQGPSVWAISSVNPPLAARLADFLRARPVVGVTWYVAAVEVPGPKDVEGAEIGGADRALAVFAASRLMPRGQPGLVVSCGTAICVERLTAEGVWQGGAIAPGLGPMASALHLRTAQVPLLDTRQFDANCPPPAWGRGTIGSLTAGLFWGTVGVVRELVARQSSDMNREPWIIWAGGDAELLAPFVSGEAARVEPHLVLIGLAQVAVIQHEPG
jgi:type III pantothenate kinase